MNVTAAEADELFGGEWFAGYTDRVEVHTEPVTVAGFDAAARAAAADGPEYVLFAAGLTVEGTLDLAEDVHSIVAVRGGLRTRRVVLGDAVLVVAGPTEIGEWLFGARNEGVFEVDGGQVESGDLFGHVSVPVAAVFDRAAGEFALLRAGVPAGVGDLVAEVLDDGEPDARRLRRHLEAGAPIFNP